MIRTYCDICDKEIGIEELKTFGSVNISMPTDKWGNENSTYKPVNYSDVCASCSQELLSKVDDLKQR